MMNSMSTSHGVLLSMIFTCKISGWWHTDATHDALLAHFSLHAPVANAVLLVFLMLLDMQVTIDFVASVNESHQQSFPLFHPDSVTPKSPVDLKKLISERVLSIAYQLNLSFNTFHAGPFVNSHAPVSVAQYLRYSSVSPDLMKHILATEWCFWQIFGIQILVPRKSEAKWSNVRQRSIYIYMLIRLYLYAALTTQWSLFLLQAFTAHCWFTVDSLVDQASGLALVWRHQTLLKVVICLRSQIPSGKDTR